MSIRKRVWTTAKGKRRLAFVVDYSFVKDGERHRAIKTFSTEKVAKAFRGKVEQHPGYFGFLYQREVESAFQYSNADENEI